MGKDHFVSVTFLKHFAEKINVEESRKTQFFIYSNEKKNFGTKKVSIESRFYENGRDGIGFFSEKLKSYEDGWDCLLKTLDKCQNILNLDFIVKEKIVYYLGLLNLNNPKRALETADFLENNATYEEIKHIEKEFGGFDNKECQKQVRDMLLYTGRVHALQGIFLQKPWVLYKNKTEIPFITSDNPIIRTSQGWYVPLSKNLLLHFSLVDCPNAIKEIKKDEEVQEINKMMRENSQRFCASSESSILKVFGEET